MFLIMKEKLFPYIVLYKKKIAIILGLSFLLALIAGMQIKLIQPLIDRGFASDSSLKEVLWLAGSLIGLAVMNLPCRFFHFYWLRYIIDKTTWQIREDIFRKMQKLPYSYFTANKEGVLISYILNDSPLFSQGLQALVELIREPLKIIFLLWIAFTGDWQLTLIFIFIAPFLFFIFSFSGKRIKKNQGDIQNALGEVTHTLSEGIRSQKMVKTFNAQNFIMKIFLKSQRKLFNIQIKTARMEEIAHPLVEFIVSIAFSSVIIFAYYRIHSGVTTIGGFMAFIGALATVIHPLRKLSEGNVRLFQSYAASDRIGTFLKEREEVDHGTIVLSQLQKKIEIRNLSFSYGKNIVLSDLSFDIIKNKKIAIVGPSGSGKSTLLDLFLGLYPVTEGDILIDGYSISDIKLVSLRNLFACISQDIFLFHDTVEKNLTLDRDITQKELEKALTISYAVHFIKALPAKMKTILGDLGIDLSGGQRQRLTIARALLKTADILLLDEATSALDNKSEKIVQDMFRAVVKNKTVITVAHRLSTIQNYDMIIVIKKGKLVEQGTHDELLLMNGEYFKMYELSLKK